MTAATEERVADFVGYATKHDVVCSDGLTIDPEAFKHLDGKTVPLLWQHDHSNPDNTLGHARLEYRPDGVIAHGYFNKGARGQNMRESVRNGDITQLSIFANQLRQVAKRVLSGNIREVSLVIGGANPGAVIEHVSMAHDDELDDMHNGEAKITMGLEIEPVVEEQLAHADTATDEVDMDKTKVEDVLATLTPEQETAVNFVLGRALDLGAQLAHSDTDGDEGEDESGEDGADEAASDEDSGDESGEDSSSGDSSDGSSDEGSEDGSEQGSEDESGDEGEGESDSNDTDSSDTDEAGDSVQHSSTNQEVKSMNLFETAGQDSATGADATDQPTLSHSDIKQMMADGVARGTSLKQELNRYALQHGIENIDYLFPDAKNLDTSPQWLARRQEWVQDVLANVRKQPFARIKSVVADITGEEARAKGYITGNLKEEEFFTLARRSTTPQTIYKKQKLDRDDVLDITDFSVVEWLKGEMKVMLDEEVAGAILIGDGRSNGDNDKIKEEHVRPIISDSELYAMTFRVNIDDANSSIEELTDAIIESRQYYKGSGNPTFYTSANILAKFQTVKDGNGRRYYDNMAAIASVLQVSKIVVVDVFDRVPDLVGIIVNLVDYSVGTDRGGQATMFDDFDLDYNKLRYLLETRLSGALTQVKSALIYRKVASSAALVTPDVPGFVSSTGVVTIPTKTGVTYTDANGVTIAAGPMAALDPGEDVVIKAKPSGAGYYFKDNVNDEWTFVREA